MRQHDRSQYPPLNARCLTCAGNGSALTREQVEQYHLPVIMKHDRRFADGGAHEAVETEALSQRVIVNIGRNRLEELLPEPLERVQEREKEQQQAISQMLAQL